jgi:hypothetical protein
MTMTGTASVTGTSWIWKQNENQKYSHPPACAIHFQTASPKIEMSWIDDSSIQLKYLSWIESHELNRFELNRFELNRFELNRFSSFQFELNRFSSFQFELNRFSSWDSMTGPVKIFFSVQSKFSLVFEQQQQRFDSIRSNIPVDNGTPSNTQTLY